MEVTTKRVLLYKEAKEIVNKINAHINDVRALILELYEGEGWTSLGYENWRECVTAEFKLEQSHVYRLLDAAQIEKNISPMGEKEIPERQLRPLIKFRDNPEKQREAWAKAVETAPDGKITAAHVAKVVKEITGEKRKEEDKGEGEKKEENGNSKEKKVGNNNIPEHAVHFVTIAISHLERIKPDDPSRERAFSKLEEWIRKNREIKREKEIRVD